MRGSHASSSSAASPAAGPAVSPSCDRTIDCDDWRMGQGQQPVIEFENGAPVGPAAGPPRGMHRLHRRLELEPSDPAMAARPLQQPLGFVDRRGIPQRGVLFGQWHVVAVGIAPCGPPRAGIEHQREQT